MSAAGTTLEIPGLACAEEGSVAILKSATGLQPGVGGGDVANTTAERVQSHDGQHLHPVIIPYHSSGALMRARTSSSLAALHCGSRACHGPERRWQASSPWPRWVAILCNG